MRKILFIILIIAVAALFTVPEEVIGEYKGLIQLKYYLKDTAYKVKDIFSQLAKTGKSEELENIGNKTQEAIQGTIEKKVQEDISNTVEEAFQIKVGAE